MLIRTTYILDTSITVRAHDVGKLNTTGHLGYMNILYKTHKLPTKKGWQFYHPPLWYFIGACWFKINELLLIKTDVAAEGLQVLTALFSGWMILLVNQIALKLHLSEKYRNLVSLLFAVHPGLIILSGSVNNDCLVTFLEMLVILLAMMWQEKDHPNENWAATLALAYITGFCVMTKMNGGVLAFPLLYLFLKRFITLIKKHQKEIKTFMIQMFYFGIISLPIGLWYQVRNIIYFGNNKSPIPPKVQYTGDYSLFERFFSFSFKEAFYQGWNKEARNLWGYIVKTSIFGEKDSLIKSQIFFYAIMTINLLLIAISVFAIFRYLFKKGKTAEQTFLVYTFFVNLAFLAVFYAWYPYICTMDFRYIVICLVPGIIFLAQLLQKTTKKAIRIPIEVLCYCFVLLSVGMMYFY